MANCMVSSDHPAFAVHKHACNSTYGPHYRDAHGQVDPRNVLVLGRAKNSIPHDVEEILREKLRANPGQSKQQNKVTVSGNALDDPEGFGAVYLIAAPDGPRAAFLKADNAHKAVRNLAKWCIEPKNKNKGPDAYKQPLSTTISNAATAIDAIHECLGAGWSAPTLGMFFRGANRILTDNKKLLSTLLTQTEEFGEDTLMATTWMKHLPMAGPTGQKYRLVKSNLAAAAMPFRQRTNVAEAPFVATKRALDIATETSESTKRPRVVEIADSD